MKIPPYLGNDVHKPILNKVEVQHSVRDLFLIWAEYSTTDSFILHLRRIDESNGLDQSFTVKLYSVSDSDDFESISIETWNSMDFQMEYFPNTIKILPYHTSTTPIMNSIKVHTHSYQDKFQIWTEYLSTHSCTIHVRRKDARCGWGQQLKLRIFQMDGTYGEDILIGPSMRQELTYNYKSTIVELQPYQTSQSQPLIPLKIYQTHRHNEFQNSYHESAFLSITKQNPEYEYYFFDNNDVKKFIRDNFNEEVLEAYDRLIPGAYKADLFRYCYLYIHGGCYFDNKQILRQPIRNLIEPNDIDIYCQDTVDYLMFNAVMISESKNKILFDIIYKIVDNVKNNFYGNNPLEPTGPLLLNKYSHNRTIKLQHIVNGNYYTESKILIRIKTDDSKSKCKFNVKFGLDLDQVKPLLELSKILGLNIVGVSFHVGSGCQDANVYNSALIDTKKVFEIGNDLNINMDIIDIGGGFPGVNDSNISFENIASILNNSIEELFKENLDNIKFIAEPGRYFVTSSYTLVCSIINKKEYIENGEQKYIYYISDGLYGTFSGIMFDYAKLELLPFNERNEKRYTSIVFGPTCDSLDIVSKECQLPSLAIGESIIIKNIGAYSIASGTEFNGFPKPDEYFILT